MSLGIMAAGLGAVSLAGSLGGWREVFAISAVPALIAVPAWLLAEIGDHRIGEAAVVRSPRRSPTRSAALMGVVFGLQSFAFGAFIAWAPALLLEEGWSEERAASAITLLGLLTIVSSLTIVRWSDRGGRRAWLLATMTLVTASLAGLSIDPGSLGIFWLIAFGIGSGATMPLCLSIPFDLCDTPTEVGELTGWMLGLGYMLAATGPAIVGGLRDLVGGFGIAFGVVTALCLLNVILIAFIPRGRAA